MKSKLIMIGMICLALLAPFISAADYHPEKMIFMTMNYKDSTVTVKDIAVGNGFYTPFSENENWMLDKCSLKVYEKNGKVLDTFFYVENKRFEDIIDPETGEITGKMNEMNDADFSVIIPYFDIEKIEIKCPSNSIVLNKAEINLTKQMIIPTYNDGSKEDKKESKTESNTGSGTAKENDNKEKPKQKEDVKTEEKTGYNSAESSEENKDQIEYKFGTEIKKKSFFLQLIEVIDRIYYYIFG